jgi:hypothetical protein
MNIVENNKLEELQLLYDQKKFCLTWTIRFGKYKDKTYQHVIGTDEKYIEWMIEKDMLNQNVKECYLLKQQIKNTIE